jgi:hypothetical protein
MKFKGIKYMRSEDEIKEYMKMPLESKLAWLQSFNKFIYKMLKGKRLKIWKKFRRGEL